MLGPRARAEAAERELTKVKLLNYLASRIGEEFDGVVTGVEEFGLFVQGIQLPAEGLVHVASLQDDYYRYERASHTLTGHRAGNAYRLGDKVRVLVARVDVDRRELDLRIVSRGGPAAKPAKGLLDPARRPVGRNGPGKNGVGNRGPSKGGPGKGKAKKTKRGKPPRK